MLAPITEGAGALLKAIAGLITKAKPRTRAEKAAAFRAQARELRTQSAEWAAEAAVWHKHAQLDASQKAYYMREEKRCRAKSNRLRRRADAAERKAARLG